MCNCKNIFEFKVGKNRVYDKDLELMFGHPCDFADITAVTYFLASKGHTLSEIYSDGFCVVLKDQKEVEEAITNIQCFYQVLALSDEEGKKVRAFHKVVDSLYLTALSKVCEESWKIMFPELQMEKICATTMDSHPDRGRLHFWANVKDLGLMDELDPVSWKPFVEKYNKAMDVLGDKHFGE